MNKERITPQFAEILGLLCAEGSNIVAYSSYWEKDRGKMRFRKNHKSERVEFCNKNPALLAHYQKLLKLEFDYSAKQTKHFKVNICKRGLIRRILSKTQLGHLKWRVPKDILGGNAKCKISFIRGYFDGDGTASNSIRFFSTNLKGLCQVIKLLENLNFNPYFEKPLLKENRKPLYFLHIRAKERKRFLSVVQPVSKKPGLQG